LAQRALEAALDAGSSVLCLVQDEFGLVADDFEDHDPATIQRIVRSALVRRR